MRFTQLEGREAKAISFHVQHMLCTSICHVVLYSNFVHNRELSTTLNKGSIAFEALNKGSTVFPTPLDICKVDVHN